MFPIILYGHYIDERRNDELKFYLLVAMTCTPVLPWILVGLVVRLLPQKNVEMKIHRNLMLSISVQILSCPIETQKKLKFAFLNLLFDTNCRQKHKYKQETRNENL